MPFVPPAYDEIVTQLTALALAKLQVVIGGVRGQLDLTEGSDILTQIEQQAFLQDFFNQLLARLQTDTNYYTASGPALEAILAIRGFTKTPANAAVAPVLCLRRGQDVASLNQAVTIPVGYRFLAADATGEPTIPFDAMQDPAAPPGVAGTTPPGASGSWVLARCALDPTVYGGLVGNIAAGSIVGIGSYPLPGVDVVSNPPVQSTTAPVVTPVGQQGSATYGYAVVARGRQGRALVSAIGRTTTGAAVLTATNYNALTVQPPGDDASGASFYDWLRVVDNDGTLALIGSTAGTIPSFADTGQTPQSYVLSAINDANYGAGGADEESDSAFHARAEAAPGEGGGNGTDDALITAARSTPGVTQAFVTDGDIPGTVTVSYVAQPNPLPPILAAQLATEVDDAAAAGAVPTARQITPTAVAVTYTYVATTSPPTGLIESIDAAIGAYFLGLSPGDPIHDSTLSAAMQAVIGVDHIPTRTYSVSGGPTVTNGDIGGQGGVLYGLGAVTVTTGR